MSISDYGLTFTTFTSTTRIDPLILDQVFQLALANNGDRRVCGVRDFRNEFIYWTYPSTLKSPGAFFPNTTLAYNYREQNWSTWDEAYTHYGTFRRATGYTWATLPYRTWSSWNDPWNFGGTSQRYPNIIGGNHQGFVLIKDQGTRESPSLAVTAIDTSTFVVTSPNHNMTDTNYIRFDNIINMTNINQVVFLIDVIDANTFMLLLTDAQEANPPTGTYIGGGIFRIYVNPNITSKQFPIFWNANRQCRVGTQRFLFDRTPSGQVTVNVFVSQNSDIASNDPTAASYLPFSNIVLTSPEPNMPFENSQAQIWHRMSNSFIGDTIQFQITLSEAQMFDDSLNSEEITLHAITAVLYPGPTLAQ